MGEEGAAGLELFDVGDGLLEVRVAEVRVAPEGVEDEDVEVLKERDALVGDVAHVGEVGGAAEAVAGDLLAAVGDGDALEAGSEEIEARAGCGVDAVKLHAGAGGIAVLGAEGVFEDAFEGVGCGVVGVDGEIAFDVKAEGAEVVEAHDVVGVAVGVEDGVDAADVFADGLGVEVGAGVDEDGVAVVGEADGGPGAAVARIAVRRDGGGADGAVAAERGHAHRGAAAEKGEGRLHRLANDAGADGAGTAAGRGLGCGGSGECLGDLEEGHPKLEESAFEKAGLFGGEVALGLFGENGQHVDALAGSDDVDLGLLALGGCAAELHDRGHVDGLDELVEAHGGRMIGAGICCADGGVEAVGGHLVGDAGLLGLLAGERGQVAFWRGCWWGLRCRCCDGLWLRLSRGEVRGALLRGMGRRRAGSRRPW